VDRWSAVQFFLDNLFRGEYPYAAHTHGSVNNFPSPFPFWYVVNLPFYFLGDVGLELIAFLWLVAFAVRYFFKNYKKSLVFIVLLVVSPAYWWEVTVRSDSLSNALLVFCFILFYQNKNYSLQKNFIFSVTAVSLLALTRFSALIPLALFFFRQYIYDLSWSKKILFPLCVAALFVAGFSPFVFWDTENWVFFDRNPFMSQTSIGNNYTLLLMLVAGVFTAWRRKTFTEFLFTAAAFIFLFIFVSQVGIFMIYGIEVSFFNDVHYDISYFTLCLPYCLAYISDKIPNSL
jgi:hypothetical protein